MALNSMGLGFVLFAKDEATDAIEKINKGLGIIPQNAKNAGTTLDAVSSKMKSVGIGIAAVGLGGVATLGAAVGTAAQFQKGMTELGTLVDKATFPMADMDRIVKSMASTYGGDLETQIAAMYQAISAGATDAGKAQGIMNAANQLAIAGATDQKTALLGLTKVLNNYNMDFSKSGEVADAFLTAIQGGSTTMGELGSVIGDVAAGAKNAGITMDELIGSLGTGATLMGNTATAATGLKAAIQGFAHPTSDAAAEAAKLGIKFDSATLRSKGLVGMLKDITSSANFSADSFQKLFGSQEAANFMTALTANNMSQLNGMMDAMGKKSGKAQAAFEEMSQTFSQQWSVMKANLQIAAVEIGGSVMPVVQEVVGVFKKLVEGFVKLPGPVKKGIGMFLAVASVALVLVGGLIAAAGSVAGLVAAAETLAPALVAVAATAGIALAALLPLIGAGALLYVMWERDLGGIRKFVTDTAAKIQLAFEAIQQLFSSGKFSGSVLKSLNDGNQGIKNFAITVFLWFNRIKNFFVGIGDGFSSALESARPVFDTFVLALRKLGDALGFGGANDPKKAGDKFAAFGETGKSIGKFFGEFATKIVAVLTNLIAFGAGVAKAFSKVKPIFDGVVTAFGNLFAAVGRLFAAFSGGDEKAQTSTRVWSMFGQYIGLTIGLVVGGIANLISWLTVAIDIITSWVGFWRNAIGGWASFMVGIFSVVMNLLSGNWNQAWAGMKETLANAVISMIKALGSLAEGTASVVDKIGKMFGKDLGAKASVKGFADGLVKDLTPAGKAPVATSSAPPVTPAAAVAAPTGPLAALTPYAGVNPGVTAAGGTAGQIAALSPYKGQAQPAQNINVALNVDGAKLHEVTVKAGQEGAYRGAQAVPAPPA